MRQEAVVASLDWCHSSRGIRDHYELELLSVAALFNPVVDISQVSDFVARVDLVSAFAANTAEHLLFEETVVKIEREQREAHLERPRFESQFAAE